jgi:hypothetical protein
MSPLINFEKKSIDLHEMLHEYHSIGGDNIFMNLNFL